MAAEPGPKAVKAALAVLAPSAPGVVMQARGARSQWPAGSLAGCGLRDSEPAGLRVFRAAGRLRTGPFFEMHHVPGASLARGMMRPVLLEMGDGTSEINNPAFPSGSSPQLLSHQSSHRVPCGCRNAFYTF